MVFDKGYVDLPEDLAYDLRQIYAKDIVGEHLKDLMAARKRDNFPLYFECLKDLYIVTRHKFADKKFNYVENNKKEELRGHEVINKIFTKCAKLARLYPAVWNGMDKSPEKVALIKQSLNNAEMFLYEALEKGNVFGKMNKIQGL